MYQPYSLIYADNKKMCRSSSICLRSGMDFFISYIRTEAPSNN